MMRMAMYFPNIMYQIWPSLYSWLLRNSCNNINTQSNCNNSYFLHKTKFSFFIGSSTVFRALAINTFFGKGVLCSRKRRSESMKNVYYVIMNADMLCNLRCNVPSILYFYYCLLFSANRHFWQRQTDSYTIHIYMYIVDSTGDIVLMVRCNVATIPTLPFQCVEKMSHKTWFSSWRTVQSFGGVSSENYSHLTLRRDKFGICSSLITCLYSAM